METNKHRSGWKWSEKERKERVSYPDAVFETVELPAGISNLNTSLANVDWDALSHFRRSEGMDNENSN